MRIASLVVFGAVVVGAGFLLAGSSANAAPLPPVPRPTLPGDSVGKGDTVTVALSSVPAANLPQLPFDTSGVTSLLVNVSDAGAVNLTGPVIGVLTGSGQEIAVSQPTTVTVQRSQVTAVRKATT